MVDEIYSLDKIIVNDVGEEFNVEYEIIRYPLPTKIKRENARKGIPTNHYSPVYIISIKFKEKKIHFNFDVRCDKLHVILQMLIEMVNNMSKKLYWDYEKNPYYFIEELFENDYHNLLLNELIENTKVSIKTSPTIL